MRELGAEHGAVSTATSGDLDSEVKVGNQGCELRTSGDICLVTPDPGASAPPLSSSSPRMPLGSTQEDTNGLVTSCPAGSPSLSGGATDEEQARNF